MNDPTSEQLTSRPRRSSTHTRLSYRAIMPERIANARTDSSQPRRRRVYRSPHSPPTFSWYNLIALYVYERRRASGSFASPTSLVWVCRRWISALWPRFCPRDGPHTSPRVTFVALLHMTAGRRWQASVTSRLKCAASSCRRTTPR